MGRSRRVRERKKRPWWTLARPSTLTLEEREERIRISKRFAIPAVVITMLVLVVVAIAVPGAPGDENSGVAGGTTGQTAAEGSGSRDDEDADRTVRIRDEMALAWGGAGNPDLAVSWWPLVTSIEIVGSSLDVETDIYPDDEGRDIARQVCNVLNGNYVLANGAGYGLESVTVYGQGRHPLAWTSAFSGHC
jgi:hypothetical protein